MDRYGEDSHAGEHAGEHALVEYGGAAYGEGGHNWAVDSSMGSSGNGGNGGPLVTFPDDRVGPSEAHPDRAFWIHAPQFHWTVVGTQDEVARQGIAQLAQETFRFGQMVESHQFYLRDHLAEAEAEILRRGQVVKEVQNQLRLLQRRVETDSNVQHKQFEDMLHQSQNEILARLQRSEENLLKQVENQQKDWTNKLSTWVDATMKQKMESVESRVQKLEQDMVELQARITVVEGAQSGQDLLMRTAKEQQKFVCDIVNNSTQANEAEHEAFDARLGSLQDQVGKLLHRTE